MTETVEVPRADVEEVLNLVERALYNMFVSDGQWYRVRALLRAAINEVRHPDALVG